ncbi:MAG: translation factor SUA5 [halophilic archaeon J07HX64]|jgi:translation factor SUA5|nr:MAG: translation factor SUA5 [halophilic archaeon J07HX64]
MPGSDIERAADAVRDGDLVVYPTETVYGLGADALDPEAVERVFDTKGRDRGNPVSMAVPDIETAAEYTEVGERERAFMQRFLPGPVTVVVERGDRVPDVLTAGRDRVGVRVPDHEVALSLLERVAPVTATSANESGRPSVRQAGSLHEQVQRAAAVVVDDGETAGGGSTVVDVARGTVHRRGALADAVEGWLADR